MNALLLTLMLVTQPPSFDMVEEKPPVSRIESANESPVTVVTVYVGWDKFGKKWKSSTEAELEQKISEANKELFKAKDRYGRWWGNVNKTTLDRDIKRMNAVNTQPEVHYQLLPQQVLPMGTNCSSGSCGVR